MVQLDDGVDEVVWRVLLGAIDGKIGRMTSGPTVGHDVENAVHLGAIVGDLNPKSVATWRRDLLAGVVGQLQGSFELNGDQYSCIMTHMGK